MALLAAWLGGWLARLECWQKRWAMMLRTHSWSSNCRRGGGVEAGTPPEERKKERRARSGSRPPVCTFVYPFLLPAFHRCRRRRHWLKSLHALLSCVSAAASARSLALPVYVFLLLLPVVLALCSEAAFVRPVIVSNGEEEERV
jgi:hypothetical protein